LQNAARSSSTGGRSPPKLEASFEAETGLRFSQVYEFFEIGEKRIGNTYSFGGF
jgi:hypothetical protein